MHFGRYANNVRSKHPRSLLLSQRSYTLYNIFSHYRPNEVNEKTVFCFFVFGSIYILMITPYPFHGIILIIMIIMSIRIITICDKNVRYILFILTIVKKNNLHVMGKKTIDAYVCICIDDASCTHEKLNRKI